MKKGPREKGGADRKTLFNLEPKKMMQILFAPAIALMHRLTYPKKFALIGLVALIAIAVLFVNLSRQLQSQIHLANDELAALEVIVPMDRLVQAAQQHRGLSSGVINGDASLLHRTTP